MPCHNNRDSSQVRLGGMFISQILCGRLGVTQAEQVRNEHDGDGLDEVECCDSRLAPRARGVEASARPDPRQLRLQ